MGRRNNWWNKRCISCHNGVYHGRDWSRNGLGVDGRVCVIRRRDLWVTIMQYIFFGFFIPRGDRQEDDDACGETTATKYKGTMRCAAS